MMYAEAATSDPWAEQTEPPRRVRVAIMGEFSAGKSTLANLLIGAPSLPVKVTATQLPPVWICHGQGEPRRVALDGSETTISMEQLADIPVHDTRFIRVFHESDVLELCDFIDMPGINDPNMSSEVWARVAHYADAVIWCSHATQAWRQSEAAVWDSLPPNLYRNSLLLLTRFDKVTSERDRERVVRRVQRETDGLFRAVLPISLTAALDAGEDFERWKAAGADAFAIELISIVDELSKRLIVSPLEQKTTLRDPAPAIDTPAIDRQTDLHPPEAEAPRENVVKEFPLANKAPSDQGLVPRRVQRGPGHARIERLPREALATMRV